MLYADVLLLELVDNDAVILLLWYVMYAGLVIFKKVLFYSFFCLFINKHIINKAPLNEKRALQ